MSLTESRGLLDRVVDRLYGVYREEGEFSDLVISYSQFLSDAKEGIHAYFPYLPPEFFKNDIVLSRLSDLSGKGVEIELITQAGGENIKALQEIGVSVYFNQGEPIYPATLVDRKSVILHHPSGFSKTRWEQTEMSSKGVVLRVISDFVKLRDESVLL